MAQCVLEPENRPHFDLTDVPAHIAIRGPNYRARGEADTSYRSASQKKRKKPAVEQVHVIDLDRPLLWGD